LHRERERERERERVRERERESEREERERERKRERDREKGLTSEEGVGDGNTSHKRANIWSRITSEKDRGHNSENETMISINFVLLCTLLF
jgi:hypothetical protein